MTSYQAVCFDTNVLLGAGWPRLSAQMQTVLRTAEILGTTPILPAAVERELAAHWERELGEKMGRLEAEANKVRQVLRAVRLNPPDVSAPTSSADAYRATVREVQREWKFKGIPFPDLSLAEAFDAAIRQTPPFESKGKGFQDYVIYRSFLDYLKTSAGCVGAFVSGDKAFQGITPHAQIRFFGSLDAIEAALEGALKAEFLKDREQYRLLVAKAFDSRFADVQEYVDKHLEVPPASLEVWGRPAKVNYVKLAGGAQNIQVPFPSGEASKKAVSVSGDFAAKVSITRQVYAEVPQPPVKIGEQIPPAWYGFALRYLAGGREEEYEDVDLDRLVRVQAVASYPNGYADLEVVSVELRAEELAGRLLSKMLGG